MMRWAQKQTVPHRVRRKERVGGVYVFCVHLGVNAAVNTVLFRGWEYVGATLTYMLSAVEAALKKTPVSCHSYTLNPKMSYSCTGCSQARRTGERGTPGDATSDPKPGAGHYEQQPSASLMGHANPTSTKRQRSRCSCWLGLKRTRVTGGVFSQSHGHPNSHGQCEGPQRGPVTHCKS